MKNIIKLTGIAILLLIASSMLVCDEDLGEDEKTFSAVVGEYQSFIRLSNNSTTSEVRVTINNTTKTMTAYGGSGNYPSVSYNLSEGSYTVYYHPASKVQPFGAGSNIITFYNK